MTILRRTCSFISSLSVYVSALQSAGAIVAPDEAAKSGADAGKPGFVDRIYLDSPKALQVKLKVRAHALTTITTIGVAIYIKICQSSICA
eukprot:COSAG06_NODE_4268_length_4417_cov_48.417554_2_plen_90_part_00